MKLRHRFSAGFFILGIVCAGVMLADRANSTRNLLMARVEARAEALASAIAEELAGPMRRGDAGEVTERIRLFEGLADVALVTVKDTRRGILHRTSDAAPPGKLHQGRALVSESGELLGSVEIYMSTASIRQAVASVSLRGAFWAAACILLLALGSWLLGALAGAKIERLVEAVGHIGRDGIKALPDLGRNSEIGSLSRAFAELQRRLGEEEGRRRKLEKLRDDMTNMLVHDMKHPLTIFRMAMTLLHDASKPDGLARATEAIALANRSTYTLDAMIDGVLQTARMARAGDPPPRTRLTIGKFLGDCAEADAMIARHSGKRWSLHIDSEIRDRWILAHAPVLRRLIGNLVLNAVDHSPEGARIRLEARLDPSASDRLEIAVVNDSGPLDRDPAEFLDAKYDSDGEGSHVGLGLAFCGLAAKWHSGRMAAERTPDGAVRISVTLPLGGRTHQAEQDRKEATTHEIA